MSDDEHAFDQTVELRIHGVSGTPPEDLLGRPLVVQIGGDATAGFYRPRLPSEERDEQPTVLEVGTGRRLPEAPGPRLEAYCWGGLTSGAPSRALWLYLLPFTLVNVAARSRADHGRPALVAVHWLGARLLGLGLTGLYVTTTIGIGVALARHPGLLPGWLTRHGPGWLMVLSGVLPLVHVLLMWLASWRTYDQYEAVKARVVTPDGDPVPLGTDDPTDGYERHLDSHDMWFNAREVRRLRAAHVQAGLGLVVLALLWGAGWWWLLPAAVLVQAVARALLPAGTGWSAPTWLVRAPWPAVAVGLLVAVLLLHGLGDAEVTDRFGPLRGRAFGVIVLGVLVVAVAGLLLVWGAAGAAAIVGVTPAPSAPMATQLPACLGLAAAHAATVASFLAGVFAGGLYLYGAAYVCTGSASPSVGDMQTLGDEGGFPAAVQIGAVAYTVGLVVLVVLALGAGLLVLRRAGVWPWKTTRGVAGYFDNDYPQPTDELVRTTALQRAMVLGSLVDLAPTVLATLSLGGLVVATVATLVVAGVWTLPLGVTTVAVQAWGGWLAIRTLVLVIALGSLAFRVPATRRKVGILWDVASFWPRTAHPLAAPCYAERTVPDLATRLSWLLSDEAAGVVGEKPQVVLAGHSQGSVIAAAAIVHLGTVLPPPGEDQPPPLEGLRLLTFGCVLRRLYGRFFPVYFGPRRLAEVATTLADGPGRMRWISLWRYTDYLGGQVSEGPPAHLPRLGQVVSRTLVGPRPWEWHAPDPAFDRPPGMTGYDAPRAHSAFDDDPSGIYQRAVRALSTGDFPRVDFDVVAPGPVVDT